MSVAASIVIKIGVNPIEALEMMQTFNWGLIWVTASYSKKEYGML